MSFLELKRKVKIDSSGHLSFHLDKLRDLVTTTPEGNYKLTDEGKEALTAIKIIETFVKAKGSKPWWWKSLWIGILLITVALAVVGYLLLHTPLERVVGGAILTFLLIGGQTCRRPWRHSYEGEQCVDKAQFGQHQTLRVW